MARLSKKKKLELAQISSDPAELEKLAGDKDVRFDVARNPNAPVSLLEKLAGDEDVNVRKEVAGNPNTPVSVLEKLAGDEEDYVRAYVAENPNTPVAILDKLAVDEDKIVREAVRQAVAKNPNTPVPMLEKLAGDEDEYVRREVAGNPNTPVSLLEKLAEDEDGGVRHNVAENLQTPVPILEKLAGDKFESWVQEYSINHDRSRDACSINWKSDDYEISELEPYVYAIECDDGEDTYHLINSGWPSANGRGDFKTIELDNFKAVEGDGDNEYLLCFTAYISTALSKHPNFKKALEKSANQVVARIQFKKNGKPIVNEDGCEEYLYEMVSDEFVEFELNDE